MRLVQPTGKVANRREPEQSMIKLLLRSRQWWARISEGDIDIVTLAREQGINDSLMSRIVRLASLSPQIVEIIIAGEQPANLDVARLLSVQLPYDWRVQADALSIAAA